MAVILVAIGMYFYLANRETNYVDSEAQLQLLSETYSKDGFEFQYPKDWTLEEKDGIRLSQGQDIVVVRVYSGLRSGLRCEPHDWREEVDKIVTKEICIKGDLNKTVMLATFSELGIKVADHIYSTMKFISADPLVKVMYPKGGEILKIDQTYNISFKNTDTSNGGTIYISPKGKDMDKSLVVDRFAYKAQAYSWKAGEVYSSDFKSRVKIAPGEYKMGICITNNLNNNSTEDCDWSDATFTITN